MADRGTVTGLPRPGYRPVPLYRDGSFYLCLTPGIALWLVGWYGAPALIGWLT